MSDDGATTRHAPRRRGRALVGGLVAALVVGVLGWALLLRPTPNSAPVPVASETAAASTTVTVGSPSPSAPTTGTSTGTSTASYLAPVYFVGRGTAANPRVLYREFVPTSVTADTAQARAQSALDALLRGPTSGAAGAYLEFWDPRTKVTVTVADEIRLVLSAPGRAGLSPRDEHLAMAQLVRTVNSATGRNGPVVLENTMAMPIFADVPNGTTVAPGNPVEDLAPVWVDSPGRYQPVPASEPVVVRGQACTFEGNVQWELRSGGSVVTSGHTTATSGCPERGEYSVALGVLRPGDYQIRVWETSMQDGSVHAEQVMPFVVR